MTPQEKEMLLLTQRVIKIENQAEGREKVVDSLMDSNVRVTKRITGLENSERRLTRDYHSLESAIFSEKNEENAEKPQPKPTFKWPWSR